MSKRLTGLLGSSEAITAGNTTESLCRVNVSDENGDLEGQSSIITITGGIIQELTPTVFNAEMTVKYGGDGYQNIISGLDILRGGSISVPAAYAEAYATIGDLGVGTARAQIGAYASLGDIGSQYHPRVVNYNAMVAGPGTTATFNLSNQAKSIVVTTNKIANQNLKIELISAVGVTITDYNLTAGILMAPLPITGYARSVKLTNNALIAIEAWTIQNIET